MTPAEQQAQFEQWLKEYAAMLQHVANGFAAPSDRDDLMQELLVALWHAVPRFRGTSKASTFVYRVAHNNALSWKRSQKRNAPCIQNCITEGVAESLPESREQEALAHLYVAIRDLAPIDRSIILLHLDSLSYAEIAEVHGMTESNVGARLTRLRQHLTNQLETITHELR